MANEARKRILIVDFDSELLIQEQILLEEYGFDVTTTWSAREALHLVNSGTFDLLLLSDYLPDATPRELGTLLRRIPSQTEVAVIQSVHPTFPEIHELLRDHVQHCALPRRTPVQIADHVIECLRQPRESHRAAVLEPGAANRGPELGTTTNKRHTSRLN